MKNDIIIAHLRAVEGELQLTGVAHQGCIDFYSLFSLCRG